jgi:membrane associated rhomboid family serine protease
MEILIVIVCSLSMIFARFRDWLTSVGIIGRSLVHVDLPHFLFNMISLLWFARYVENFALVYWMGVVFSGIPAQIAHRRSFGASGGVCAVVWCVAVKTPLLWTLVLFVPIPVIVWAAVCVVFRTPRTDYAAHLIGCCVGIFFGVIL